MQITSRSYDAQTPIVSNYKAENSDNEKLLPLDSNKILSHSGFF